jgi:hypothetical protein
MPDADDRWQKLGYIDILRAFPLRAPMLPIALFKCSRISSRLRASKIP